jgi:DNA-binding beta-propeller fold protein YncE
MGDKPVRGLVTSDNAMLYVANFGSDAVSIFSVNDGRLLGSVQVGRNPDAIALTPAENFLLVANSGSGDVAVVRLAPMPRGSKISTTEAILKGKNPSKTWGLVTLIPVGNSPNAIIIKTLK